MPRPKCDLDPTPILSRVRLENHNFPGILGGDADWGDGYNRTGILLLSNFERNPPFSPTVLSRGLLGELLRALRT